MTQAAKTEFVSVQSIVGSREFADGVRDVRQGLSPAFDRHGDGWSYERGRLFACIAPLNMQVRIGGKVNPKAVALCQAAWERRLII
jgi:hypothetical protein